MRFFRIVLCILLLSSLPAFAQWRSDWASTSLSSGVVSGWLAFQRTGETWNYRFYTLDTLAFRVMQSPYSQTAAYTYTFSAAERLAGVEIYSMGEDLTGDGIVDFYVLSAYGTATPYRQGFRIFSLPNNQTVFQRDDVGNSYSYPTLWDVDHDGILECTYVRHLYPSFASYYYESFETGVPAVTGGDMPALPLKLSLGQNYPNPFNPATRIEYELSTPGQVRLEVVNLLGQTVTTLLDTQQSAGRHIAMWNGRDAQGNPQATGPYYYRIFLNGQPVQTKQMLLLR